MAVDPSLLSMGIAPPQGINATQQGMPPQAGPDGIPLPPDPTLLPGQAQVAPPKKPPTLIPSDVARLLAEAINATKMEAAKGLAGYLGDPRGTVNVKDRDLIRIWRKRNPNVDPLYEKLVNGLSDEEITYMMYPARRALIRYGRRTYTEQVEFAERMAILNADPRFDDLDEEIEEEEEEEQYIPPQADFPSKGEEFFEEEMEERVPTSPEEETESEV